MKKLTYGIEYVDTNTGKCARGIYRFSTEQAAKTEAQRLQNLADKIARPVRVKTFTIR